jgi:hypothetical protein
MDLDEKNALPELGFRADVPADLVILDMGAWPWVVGVNDTRYKFHADKHVQVLEQMRHAHLGVGDTIQVTASVTKDKKVKFVCDIIARYTPPEGSEEHTHWVYEALCRHQLRCMNSTILNVKKSCMENNLEFKITPELLPAILSSATGLAIESHKRFNCTAFHSDPMDLPF